jgi:hypothetical protein
VSAPAQGPGTPFLGRRRAAPDPAYLHVVGAHRALGTGGPSRGYLFTVALLAGTASMPILAAISAGSATVGNSALPDSGTPFIPTPSVGPVVVSLPSGSQPAVGPDRTPTAGPAATSLPVAATPAPTATAEPTSTFSGPAGDPSATASPSTGPSADPAPSGSPDVSPPPPGTPPTESPEPPPSPAPRPSPPGLGHRPVTPAPCAGQPTPRPAPVPTVPAVPPATDADPRA